MALVKLFNLDNFLSKNWDWIILDFKSSDSQAMFIEIFVGYSTLFTFWSGGMIVRLGLSPPPPLGDIIIAQLACPLNDVIIANFGSD